MQKLTREQAAIIAAYTGYMAGPFDDFHKYIEEKLGRPVWTHEIANPEVNKSIKDAAMPDFMSLCADGVVE